ncbi:gliding motility lipoprotein GldH [Mesonia sp.]|uniref:gliding motility lipoprotein GldH n=1 Tax=Mesonia sp. TaxID=1960830 RepID=UPI001776DE88|nr:gliding motility lipoprotein GldH [Mesonia sp.]HIB36186.1 gliding motility lipoprotein GldH [Mesonia sp.]HIO26674.1 gliding motility lipoprotein GldH [Flavobacteriaceae bacterium]
MHKSLVYSLLAIICLVSCDTNREYDVYRSLPENGWHKDSIISFNVKEIDTTNRYNLFINLRNNSNYNYNNLYLITEMNFPNGKVISDTLEYEMAYPNGDWMGVGFGEIKESKLWYKAGVQFPESGTYQINIRQAMRKNGNVNGIQNLEGITDVGFRIEKP